MSTVTTKDIRAWGIANGQCGRTGKLPQHVIDGYMATHPDDVIADLPAPVAAEQGEDVPADDVFTVTVDVTGHDDTAMDISQHLVNAIYAAFEAGRAAERQSILAALGGTA
jgi:hypothetical protein